MEKVDQITKPVAIEPAQVAPAATVPAMSTMWSNIKSALNNEPIAIDPDKERVLMEEVTNVFGHVDTSTYLKKKQGLSYLSWAKAWEIVLNSFPNAIFDIITFDSKPYMALDCGVFVWTTIKINHVTRYMWLPVMDMRGKSVKESEMDGTQLNKTLMRCLVKNLAMFKLGLNVYNGDDLPGEVVEDKKKLSARIKQIMTLGQKLAATHKEEVRQIISTNNNGDANPANITDLDICDRIITALKELEG